jgi:hypothetical protein
MNPELPIARAALAIGAANAGPASIGVRRRKAQAPAKPLNPQPLPRWITEGEGAEAAFAGGAAVFALDQVLRAETPWLGCWRMRLALKAAASLATRLRLGVDAVGLRDALHLTRAGDDPGPAGRLHLRLRRWASRPLRLGAEAEAEIMQEIAGSPAAGEIAALLAADRALAERLGWVSPLPLHLAGIDDAALRDGAQGRRLKAGVAGLEAVGPVLVLRSAMAAHVEAVTLARRADAVAAAAASLRTRDEGRGLAILLADDSVAPWRMAGKTLGGEGMNSDRAARRFCESLHAKGALRLLTDRPSLRLYGL